jgi:pteridine reductase
VLVSNASSFSPTRGRPRSTTKDWDELIGSNLLAPLFLSQAATPAAGAHRAAASSTSSTSMPTGSMKNYVVYEHRRKGGAGQRSRARWRANSRPEVRVNGVAPGAVTWPRTPTGRTSWRASASSTPAPRSRM